MRGKVKWFDDKRGYGFITGDDGRDVYVHFTAISKDGYRTLKHNWRVSFDVELSADNRPEDVCSKKRFLPLLGNHDGKLGRTCCNSL